MDCPSCGVSNLGGKLFCFKCGAKLTEGGEAVAPRRHRPGRKKMPRISPVFIVLVLILGFAVLAVTSVLKIPLYERPEMSEGRGDITYEKIRKMRASLRKGKRVELFLTEEEINSYIEYGGATQLEAFIVKMEEYCGPGVFLEEVNVYILEDGVEVILRVFVEKGALRKPLIINAAGVLEFQRGEVTLIPDWVKVGSASVPVGSVNRYLGWLAKDGTLFSVPVGELVQAVSIEDGQLVVSVGKKPEKGVADNGSNVMIIRAREALKAGNLGVAFRLFGKFSTDFPEDPQAVTARHEASEIRDMVDKLLVTAHTYRLEGKLVEAVDLYRSIAGRFEQMVEAEEAQQRLDELRQDPDVREAMRKHEAEQKAKSGFQLAENLFNAKLYDVAVEHYQRVISNFPDTSYAQKARKRIEEIKNR